MTSLVIMKHGVKKILSKNVLVTLNNFTLHRYFEKSSWGVQKGDEIVELMK